MPRQGIEAISAWVGLCPAKGATTSDLNHSEKRWRVADDTTLMPFARRVLFLMLVDAALKPCNAGISLRERDANLPLLRWVALSGHCTARQARPQRTPHVLIRPGPGIRIAIIESHLTPPETHMATKPKEQNPIIEKSEDDIDRAVDDTFPASDPPATSGATRIESEDGEEADEDSAK
ncbi:hypothetical protein J8I87_36490 [Paraburkholderia sp. LEh10]|uniref:hypothetical protein n=1 Tax=Paraburkholderia sp. LEh10 TaxID=2821353 RepID=UPI001AE72DAA|nr:hypothetical protein [Paraburkholderia sp. LEh10]MBP0595062.1 hypothetical protein [Paraburkholderia sp. LEh10]